MEFKEAMRIFSRICKERERCDGCVLSNKCIVLKDCDYSTAEAILAKWADAHPEKTIADDFFDKHPKATTYSDGTPFVCAKDCGYGEPEICKTVSEPCIRCWRRPMEEVEG